MGPCKSLLLFLESGRGIFEKMLFTFVVINCKLNNLLTLSHFRIRYNTGSSSSEINGSRNLIYFRAK